MEYEFVGMLLGFLAVIGTIVISFLNLSGRIESLGRDLAEVRDKLSRLEGLLEGYFSRTKEDSPPPV